MRLSIIKCLCTLLFICCYSFSAKSQQANPTHIGSAKGLLQDTVHKYTVKSATVSIYRSDSSLINYQLSNNYGEFVFKNLPINKSYYIEISHISYQLLRKGFTLTDKQTSFDLKTIILNPKENSIKEVEIRVPPIQMNGDTLEFNAAAFKLDSNAVVEDLLKKIPNITLWGDGQITVNGKEVKSLLVNGKEFFGGDFKMATQNISKNAVQKIQVYNTQRDQNNPLDSSLTVNLKLKKGKDKGHFGKVGGGYGTDSRFEGDASLNAYAPKLQLGIIGASNNTNKIANSINSLTASSTFKNNGINVEYQPNFRTSGINQTNTGGATFSYNFIEKPTYQNKKELTANYFFQNKNLDVNSNSLSTTTSGANQTQSISSKNKSSNNSMNHSFDSKYSLGSQKHQLYISQNTNWNEGDSYNQSDRNATSQNGTALSINNTESRGNSSNKSLNLNADYSYSNYLNFNQKIRNYNVRYNLGINANDQDRTETTHNISFSDAALNRDYNRRYNNHGSEISQQLYASIPNLKRLFFGNKNIANVDFSISNDLSLNNSNTKNSIGDLDLTSQTYNINTYLSNNQTTNTLTEVPSFTIAKSWYKRLSNRFNRNITIDASAKHKFLYQDNRSEKDFQDIKRSYSNFIPAASFRYYMNQYGEYNNNLSVNFNTDIQIPTIEQLAPLTDSSRIYSLQKGNINLHEANIKTFSMSFYHYDQRGKNTLNYNFRITGSLINNALTDSILQDISSGKRTNYITNADGNRSANVYTDIRKLLKLKESTLQINLLNSGNISRTPIYLNDQFSFSNNWNTSSTLSFNYTYKSKFAFETKETVNFSESRQNAFKTRYSGSNISTAVSGSYNLTKKFSLNSNISLNTNNTSGNRSIDYKIWNASATYRFLKGNNAEFKFTALDLLRQNNSVSNNILSNGLSFTERNVLQQYFMTTLSYYPRQFGKK